VTVLTTLMTRTTCATGGRTALHRWQVAIFYGWRSEGWSGVLKAEEGEPLPTEIRSRTGQAQTLMLCGSRNMCASDAFWDLTVSFRQRTISIDIWHFETDFGFDRAKGEANCGCKCSYPRSCEMINWKLINYVKLWRGNAIH